MYQIVFDLKYRLFCASLQRLQMIFSIRHLFRYFHLFQKLDMITVKLLRFSRFEFLQMQIILPVNLLSSRTLFADLLSLCEET